MYAKVVSTIITAAAIVLPVTVAFAGGGTPIDEAGQNALDIGVGLGGIACAGGVIGACAGGLMRNGAILATGATTAVCGGAWAGAPQLVEKIIGTQTSGLALSDMVTPAFKSFFGF